MTTLKRHIPPLETSRLDRPQGDQKGEGLSKGQLDHLMESEQSQKSPSIDPLDVLTQEEVTALECSRQSGRWGTQTRRQANKEGLIYKRRNTRVKHEMKAWAKVAKSGRLKFIVEGKAKRGSDNCREKETGRGPVDPFLSYRAKALAEAVGLQKVWNNNGGNTITHEMHLMECSGSPRRTEKRNSWTVPTRMGSHGGVHTGNQG